ncbi:MAG: aminotransferase class V-fold PLP-dependent enzyme [Planctomycetes bacterium]|nr:aminotransferase class V-fold PLP-dependent enzyme [Planctomycetota bacterium]
MTQPTAAGRATSAVHDPARWRKRFPILASTNYLVTHSLGAMPDTVHEKLKLFTDQWATRGVRAWAEGWWDAPITVGNLLGRILNAPPNTVAMHQNVSVIQGLVASALDFSGKRNKVVYTEHNFPTNMYVWEGFKKLGARIHVVKSPDGIGVPTEDMLAAIDEETLIVPISHVFFRTSFMQDAAAICKRAKEVGALVLLDTYQSLGCVPIDVQALDVDMVCGGSVKWLCGGPGAGYLYVKPSLQAKLEPKITGWAAHAAPFAFELGAQRYANDARRLLHGSPAVPSLYAASAGYEIILDVGVDAIRAHSTMLTEWLRGELGSRGFRVTSPTNVSQRAGTLTVALAPDEHGPAFVAALEARGILVDHRPEAGLRVSPHFYTEQQELASFADSLAELRRTKKWQDFVGGKKAY